MRSLKSCLRSKTTEDKAVQKNEPVNSLIIPKSQKRSRSSHKGHKDLLPVDNLVDEIILAPVELERETIDI